MTMQKRRLNSGPARHHLVLSAHSDMWAGFDLLVATCGGIDEGGARIRQRDAARDQILRHVRANPKLARGILNTGNALAFTLHGIVGNLAHLGLGHLRSGISISDRSLGRTFLRGGRGFIGSGNRRRA